MIERAHPAEPGASRTAIACAPGRAGCLRTALGWEPREAPRASEEQPLAVHLPEYVALVAEMSSRSASFDADTPTSPGLTRRRCGRRAAPARWWRRWPGAASARLPGAAPAGTPRRARAGDGLLPVRERGGGGAVRARPLGAERIFVLDWDVHHGNGTNTIFHGSREVLFCSIHQYPFWPGTGPLEDVGEGDVRGSRCQPSRARAGAATRCFSRSSSTCAPIARRYRPDLILISAGYDAHRDDPPGVSPRPPTARWRAGYGPSARRSGRLVGAVLEGGYDLRALASSVAATMEALGGAAAPAPEEPALHSLAERAAWCSPLGSLNQLR